MTLSTTTDWFRKAAPYIHAHRFARFVIAIDSLAIASDHFDNLVHDLALLNSLGIKLVVTFGARHQIEQQCRQQHIPVRYHRDLRITDSESLAVTKAIVGQLRTDIEAKFSVSLPHTPMADAKIRCSSGNFITAKPIGILEGVDHGFTGQVRRIDTEAIQAQLALDQIVLLPPLGFSPAGEVFNLSVHTVATMCAQTLGADKLIIIGDKPTFPRELTLTQAEKHLKQSSQNNAALMTAITACRAGVKRVHLLDRDQDDALLQELFSHDGAGTLVSADPFDRIRAAKFGDISGIMTLIKPLEKDGVLLARSREEIASQLEDFMVIERDGTVIACAALRCYPSSNTAELACLAVSDNYRGQGRGEQLLTKIEREAHKLGGQKLYVLTTQTAHWFIERGFTRTENHDLPVERKRDYSLKRNAQVFIKHLG